LQNLAGNKDCDAIIEQELIRSGIAVVHGPKVDCEVAYSLTGKLGKFEFVRAWRYWVAKGDVPLVVAQELYADPVGVTDIRVDGDCTCPPPEDRAEWRDQEGNILCCLVPDKTAAEIASLQKLGIDVTKEKIRWVENPSQIGQGFITQYHIDSEIGLRVFVDTLKRHKLV